MRILHVGQASSSRGGIGTFLTQLTEGELARRHDLELLDLPAPDQGGTFTIGNLTRTLSDVRAVWKRAKGRDVVHIHSALSPAPTLLRAGALATAARARGCRVVVHAHGGRIALWLTPGIRRWIARVSLAPASVVAAVADRVRATLATALPETKLVLIRIGIETARFEASGDGHTPPRVLYAGFLTSRKGVLDLLAASAVLKERGVEHELMIAGGAAPDPDPQAAAAVAAAGEGVLALGEIPNDRMPEVYRSADVFCLPSWWEAMPVSVLEAMASGLPIVATDVGDVRIVVGDGICGSLVPPRDVEALTGALEEMLSDRDLRRQMGSAGRARAVAEYDLARTVDAIDTLYGQLVPRA